MLATSPVSTVSAMDCTSSQPRTADEMLLRGIARGDKRAMEQLFARHNRQVYHFVCRLTQNASLAEDVVSDVFLVAWRSAGSFEGRSQVSTWLLAIARRRALAALRRRAE